MLLVALFAAACGRQAESYTEADVYMVVGDTKQHQPNHITLFQEVLRNERQFYSQYRGFVYLNEFDCEYPTPTSIAIFDMNGNGIEEVIVNHQDIIKLVLHYHDGIVFGTEFGIRSMNEIMTDGRFFVSPGGAGNFGISELSIAEGVIDFVNIYTFDAFVADREYPYVHHFNVLNGISVSDEEFESWYAQVTARELIGWYSFTDESIENLAALITPRYVTKENDTNDNPQIIFTTTMRIHEDMPIFTFHRIIGEYIEDMQHEAWYEIPHPRKVTIIIEDEDGSTIQTIYGLTQTNSAAHGLIEHRELVFEDFTFNGFLDMRLLRHQDSAGGLLATEYFWLWDDVQYQFVLNEQLIELGYAAGLQVNQENRQIEIFNRDWPGPTWAYYEWVNGAFKLAGNTVTMRIHEEMPFFFITRRFGGYVTSPEMTLNERHVTISITDEYGTFIQEIDGVIQGGHADWMTVDVYSFNLQFDDLNFNGYLDMWFFTAINPGTASGAWAQYWLWDSDAQQFVKNEQLSEISCMAWLSANQDTQQVEVFSRGSGRGPWVTSYYKWNDGNLIPVAGTRDEWVHMQFVEPYITTIRWDFITGEVSMELDERNTYQPCYVITKTVDINPDMDFPTYKIRLEMWRLPDEYCEFGYEYEIAIIVHGKRKANNSQGWAHTFQDITGLRAGYGYGRWIEIDPENPLNLHFVDFNGDGYLDMALRRLPPQTGGMADDPHYFWLFNPDPDVPLWQGNFQRTYSLEHAASFGQIVEVDNGHVTIFEFSSVMYQYWGVYVYTDGEFVFDRIANAYRAGEFVGTND